MFINNKLAEDSNPNGNDQVLIDEKWQRIERLCRNHERELGKGMDYQSNWYEDILKQIELEE